LRSTISIREQLEVDKAKVFIASSSRTLVLAEKLRDQLSTKYCNPVLWSEQGRNAVGLTIIELMEGEAKRYDFAVIILSKDDVLSSGSSQVSKARDNCVFEAWLFISAIGRRRCFLVNSVNQTDLPSDLGGVISIPFQEPTNLRDREACANAVTQVAAQLKDIVQSFVLDVSPIINITYPVYPKDTLLEGIKPRFGGRSYLVRGSFKNLPADHRIWILNEDPATGKLWPQDHSAVEALSETEWKGLTFVGDDQENVTLVAVMAPQTSHDFFVYYHTVLGQTQAFPLSRLPAECKIFDRAQARRK
jgi:hypothetical protein